ncbi:unnamed protein product [Paramecium octaurelia]|uniref:Uncharacterized protein n=1 Tax=Paramecium octaurelia TaxID=43137 RepID=A0A8S1WW55_PAROT|nr:unnamed protein product [Paramecium octaurelia]
MLSDVQLDIDKLPKTHIEKLSRQHNQWVEFDLNSLLIHLDSLLLQAEHTQISILDSLQSLKEKQLRGIEDIRDLLILDQRDQKWIEDDLATCNYDQEQGIKKERDIDDFGLHINNWNIVIIYYKFVH